MKKKKEKKREKVSQEQNLEPNGAIFIPLNPLDLERLDMESRGYVGIVERGEVWTIHSTVLSASSSGTYGAVMARR